MGKRRRYSDREEDLLNKLKRENKQLKDQVSKLRKQLARIDLDRYQHVKNILEEHYIKEEEQESADIVLERMKNEWRCHTCHVGTLEIVLYDRAGNTFYFRQCDNCENRTKSKPYSPSVSGIIKNKVKSDT